MELELRINGMIKSLNVAANESLLTVLRREGYCSVKQGCETGECGACAVLVDGVPRPSCVTLAAQVGGCTLTTAENLDSIRPLHPLQQAFIDMGAVQCGFCTSGMLVSAYALLQRNRRPTESEVRDALSGHLCRCIGYTKPIQAVLRAAAIMRGEEVAPIEYRTVDFTEENVAGCTGKESVVLVAGGIQTREALWASAGSVSGSTMKLPALSAGVNTALPAQTHRSSQWQAVGKPVPGIDAVKFVTGRAAFAGDSVPRGMLYARVLTSPHAHAKIRDIDVSQAKELPGVHAVLTYKDVPHVAYSSIGRLQNAHGPRDQYCLDNRMRYVGDRVAVVVAETPEEAEQAISLIQVDYEILPAILSPRQALGPDAPCIHPEPDSRGIHDAARNVVARAHTETGDVEHSFATSDLVIENEYIVPAVQQAPIENHTVVTYFDEDNYLIVQTNTNASHHMRRTLAEILNIPARHIRIVKSGVGGDFGVKQEVVLEDLCAFLTVITNQPVMLAYSRKEEFSSRWNQECIVRLKTGVKHDGTIVANQMLVLTSTGAYGTHPLIDQSHIAASVLALYPCANMRFIAEVLYTNTPPAGALRGYAMPESFFALESHMDEIALKLGMDALQFRRKNWIKVGDEYPFARDPEKRKDTTPYIESSGLSECLQIVEKKLFWSEKRGQAGSGRFRRGVGVALSLYGNPHITRKSEAEVSGAIIKLNEDGSFDVFVDASEESGAATMLAQMVAEILGVPLEDVLMHSSEASITPLSTAVNPSTMFYTSGEAVRKAAEQIRRQILMVAGRMLNALPEALKISARTITAPSGQAVTVTQVATHALYSESRHIMTTVSAKVSQTPTSFAAQGVEVEVDTEMGNVRVLKAITAVDVGQTINPLLVEGQIQGSVMQALGTGICEELIYDQKGNLLTTNFRDYHICNTLDVPDVQTYLVETYDPSGPFGAKAVVDIALNGIAPALANAVADALGIRLRQIPLTPERILRALYAQKTRS